MYKNMQASMLSIVIFEILSILIVNCSGSAIEWITPIIDPFTTTPETHTTELPVLCRNCQVHPQQHYCDTHRAVVKAKIIQRLKHSLNYVIEIQKIFKGPKKLKTQNRLINIRACPADLTSKKTYLITGDTGDDEFTFLTSGCHWVQEFRKLSIRQKRGLRKYYKHSCRKCKISSCSGDNCSISHRSGCMFDLSWNNTVAKYYKDHAYCKQRNGKCRWISRKIMKRRKARKGRNRKSL